MPPAELDRVERMLLMHLLEHHGQQVRFEASPWVTEFGIVRRFPEEPSDALRRALRALEMGRLVYRRTQYVVGYSEPKQVYSLTPSGHRKAVEVREVEPPGNGSAPPDTPMPTEGPTRPSSTDVADAPGTDGSAEPTV
ncbi:MAG TPA: hypothetical protein VEH10_02595 [Thermoplasmata archaeon]|nr:hypothetical protein [Thermoplasmata archaeon]